MPAIITDQFRILNAETFTKSLTGIGTTTNNYYTFLAHPNPSFDDVENYGVSNWSNNPPEPKDSFQQENLYFDSMLFLKKVTSQDVARVIPRINWTSGVVYDMYRNNYDIDNGAPQTSSKTLYDSRFYAMNSEFKVYLCINNGANPDFPNGQKSVNEPTGEDLNPREYASDGYSWKYMYSIKPSEIIKFTTEQFIPVPSNWGDPDTEDVKNNATNGHIETVVITNKGSGYTTSNGNSDSITGVKILGDGTGGTATVNIQSGEIESVQVSNGGSDYTRAFINFDGESSLLSGSGGRFEVVIPPKNGHGNDIYREMGAYRVMVYSKYDADADYVVGNNFSRVGIVKNPTVFGDKVQLVNTSTATSLNAIKLKPATAGLNTSGTIYPVNDQISQTIGAGVTAVGYVASYDSNTGVLRYYQPVGLSTFSISGFDLVKFSGTNAISCISPGGDGSSSLGGSDATPMIPDALFDNTNTITIGGKSIALGQTFNSGFANPDIEKYSGEIIYVDNRPPITRSASQKEEVKIVVEF